jgi:hypothetical protein
VNSQSALAAVGINITASAAAITHFFNIAVLLDSKGREARPLYSEEAVVQATFRSALVELSQIVEMTAVT